MLIIQVFWGGTELASRKMLTYFYVRCAFFSLNSYYLTHITVLICLYVSEKLTSYYAHYPSFLGGYRIGE